MDFVDEQNGLRGFGELLQNPLEALFEVATVFCSGQQRAHVKRVNTGFVENLRYVVLDDPTSQTLGDGGLANAGFADQQRIVFAATAKRLDHPLEFLFASDQRVNLALQRQVVEIDRVAFQRPRSGLRLALGFHAAFAARRSLWNLADAVGNEIDHVEPGDSLLLQVIHRVRILLAKNGNQHIGTIDFLFTRRLNVQNGALDNALKAKRWLSVDVFLAVNGRGMLDNEFAQIPAQLFDVSAAGAQGLRR